jgi:hypothetical protein
MLISKKNPLINTELAYLRQNAPHRKWHYLLGLVALVIATAPVWYGFKLQSSITLIQVMAIPILIVYWLFQLRIMQSACLLGTSAMLDIEDAFMDSQWSVALARVNAVLRHHRFFIYLISLALLGLSMTVMLFLFFGSSQTGSSRGILKYVGSVSSAYFLSGPYENGAPFLQRPVFTAIAGNLLLMFTFGNSLLSISFGLWAGRLGRTLMLRLFLLSIVFSIFLGLYALREMPAWTCHRSWMLPDRCSHILFQMRVADSLQAISLTFLDGGTSLVTGIHCPVGRGFELEGYQVRHFLAGGVAAICQLALSGFILWRISLSKRSTKPA